MTGAPNPQELRCKRCGAAGPLADSHIIPGAFFRQIQQESAVLLQIGWAEHAYQQKLRKGLYVTDILCPACDNWLNQTYEQQAIRALTLNEGVTWVHYLREDLQFWRMDDVDLDLLKLFLLSILWRAHTTQLGPCGEFTLGSTAGRIQQMILSEDAGARDEFPVLATRFDVRAAILLPHAYELEGVPYWEINLGDWHFLVKADRQPTPPPFDECELRPDGPRLVIPRDFSGSAHHRLLHDLVIRNRDRKQRSRKDVAS